MHRGQFTVDMSECVHVCVFFEKRALMLLRVWELWEFRRCEPHTVYCRCFVPLTVSTKKAEVLMYLPYYKIWQVLRKKNESVVFIS